MKFTTHTTHSTEISPQLLSTNGGDSVAIALVKEVEV